MTKQRITARQIALIERFISDARSDDFALSLTNLWAALPRNHKLITTNATKQIRKVKDQVIACGFDQLDNLVVLYSDGSRHQVLQGETSARYVIL